MQKEYRARVSMRNPVHFLALGFGSGLVPFMPGTFGSLAAVPLIYFSANLPVALFITFTLVASVVGIYLCGKTADDMQVHDHGSIVWDEVAGMFISFLFVPITAPTLLIGFLLFRLFDILKPWPIGVVDNQSSPLIFCFFVRSFPLSPPRARIKVYDRGGTIVLRFFFS